MARRLTMPVTLLTVAVLAVTGLVAWPAPAAWGDDWSRGHRHRRAKVVHVAPAPVVVWPPAVVVRPPARVWVPGHYESRQETRWLPGPAVAVWVPPRLEARWVNGRFLSVEAAPGHYDYRPGPAVAVTRLVRVWVPGAWVRAAQVAAYRARWR